jgi:hypothetical protein
MNAADDRNRQQQPPRTDQRNDQGAGPRFEPIKISSLHFRDSDIYLAMTSPLPRTLTAGAHPKRPAITVEIQHEPWHRMYRVREVEGGKVVKQLCIPETWAAYAPEPAGQ